ncbi:MAG: radical SAM protein [Lachnospiraceae bacterium]|nr:radical SAM protein [Lachnospiraceae bacterium]MBQ4067953.1 radical SAM protein [Lachnospiraceae bacterium]
MEFGGILKTMVDNECTLCPRECKVNRDIVAGYCGCDNKIRVARAALHFWEEPCISGEKGSGTVFFSGCNLRCCYCQNYTLSHQRFGKEVSSERLGEIFLELQDKGANNINLVTPTHYVDKIIKVLDNIRKDLKIPVVYNCGGYEKINTIKMLKDYVDIFLHDIKYYDNERAFKYSSAPDYFKHSSEAVNEMIRITGNPIIKDGIMKKGVIIRHLVLPGGKEDSMSILNWINHNLKKDSYILSLMNQYTPYYKSIEHPEINRRLTTYEYEKVLNYAIELGLTNGYMQERSSAKKEYTPEFDLTGV